MVAAKWPTIKPTGAALRAAGINAIGGALIYSDNKEFNTASAGYYKTGKSNYVGTLEDILRKSTGYKGNPSVASSKADFQYFDLKLAEQLVDLPPQLQSFVSLLKQTAQGEIYGEEMGEVTERRKGKSVGTGEKFGGLGSEFKGTRVEMEITQDESGQFGLKGRGPGGRKPTLETSITQRTVGSTLPYAPGGGVPMARPKEWGVEQRRAAGVLDQNFFRGLLTDRGGMATRLFGSSGASSIKKVTQKIRNLFTQVTIVGGGKRHEFIYFIQGLTPSPNDISGNWEQPRRRLQWSLNTAFEHKMEKVLAAQFGQDGLRALADPKFKVPAESSGAGILILGEKGIKGLEGLTVTSRVLSTKSVPLTQVFTVKVPKSKSGVKRGPRSRGQFISNVQLSSILQKRLAKVMPRFSEPQRPTPRYVTGGLAQSFQIMANYRIGLMGYFNTPPASGYVDELNQNGWMLDNKVELTIRQITQQLFGRQFRVLRTQ